MSKPIDLELITRSDVQERFWSKVDKSAGPDGCWIWRGAIKPNGYGKVSIGAAKASRWYYTHRIAYAMHNVTDPADLFVCHHCDNPVCCNPSHLFLGTDQDNKTDMVRKGRQGAARGVESANAKFAPVEVLSIRERYANGGVTCLEIAVEYGVDETTISGLVRGETYKEVNGPLSNPKQTKRGEGHPGAYLNADKVRAIRRLQASGGHTLEGIGAIVGATKYAVHDVIRGKTWKHVA